MDVAFATPFPFWIPLFILGFPLLPWIAASTLGGLR